MNLGDIYAETANDPRRRGHIMRFLINTDTALLRSQKQTLFHVIDSLDYGMKEDLTGILRLIDSLQDTLVESGLRSEFEVFGERTGD